MVIQTKLNCLRCLYEWVPRIRGRPRQCPRCKSPMWDKPKQENRL